MANAPSPAPRAALLPFERRWAEAALEGFAPPGGPGLAPRPGEADWLGTLDRLWRVQTWQARLGLRAGIWLAGLSPFWLQRRLASLPSLPAAERARLLEALLGHRSFIVGELTVLLKMAACMALLGTAAVRERSGYDRVEAGGAGPEGEA